MDVNILGFSGAFYGQKSAWFYMANRKKKREERLTHLVITRINDTKYKELQKLLEGDPNNDMAQLLRDILYNKPIRVFTKDRTLDNTMEELAKIRSELRAIGVNINQITRHFNTYPEEYRKQFYAKVAFREHQALQPKIEELLEIISKLAKRWLQGSDKGGQ